MDIVKLSTLTRGWFVGSFEPTAFKTDKFEVGYHKYKKGQKWSKHYHKLTTEVNYIIKGKMTINGQLLKKGDVFIIHPNEVVDPEYLTDCELIITRDGSFPNDKYIIE